MAPTKLGLIGYAGRMGTTLREHLAGRDDIILHCQLERGEALAGFIARKPDVIVDLSLGASIDAQGPDVAAAGVPYVVGATGYQLATVERLREAATQSGTPVLIVPNFSIGANLLLRYAASASKLMHAPVITERHHIGKADAPSGTARFTAQRIAEARAGLEPGPSQLESTAAQYKEQLAGVLGGVDNGIAIHSARGEGYLAEQEVRLCLPGEVLLLEHRSIDRRCFMPGIVYAIKNISKVHGLMIGLDSIMD